jgi:hypothetical protein
MPTFSERVISSWDEFTKLIPTTTSPGKRPWLFRGQSEDWELTTKIERVLGQWDIGLDKATIIEFQTIREFRRRLRDPEYHLIQNDTLFCLALMQHHGAPTRLLDCTYSPFVAAAFAMEHGASKMPVIWCFNGDWGDRQARKCAPDDLVDRRNDDKQRIDETFLRLYQFEHTTPAHSRYKFVKQENPLHLNERLTAQQGAFLCTADLRSSFQDNLKAMEDWDSPDNLVKLRLRLMPDKAINFARNLKDMNLSFAALFPDLDGFGRSIGQQIMHHADLADSQAGVPYHLKKA